MTIRVSADIIYAVTAMIACGAMVFATSVYMSALRVATKGLQKKIDEVSAKVAKVGDAADEAYEDFNEGEEWKRGGE